MSVAEYGNRLFYDCLHDINVDDVITWISVIATAVLAGATAVLAGYVGWQTKLQKKELGVLEQQLRVAGSQTEIMIKQLVQQENELKLSHRPYIYPRFVRKNENMTITNTLEIVNIGRGDAKDVHLEVKDAVDKTLGKLDVYVLQSGEGRNTGIIL
ncbi:MAG: hypothetical protein KGI11_10040, partial [Thaumarchaeota archaeon]|nr:hypothetical protein [Nitrososphaerota archaeon]